MHLPFHELESLISARVEISEADSVGDLAHVRAVLLSSVLSPRAWRSASSSARGKGERSIGLFRSPRDGRGFSRRTDLRLPLETVLEGR